MSLKLKGTRYVGLLRGIGPRKKRDEAILVGLHTRVRIVACNDTKTFEDMFQEVLEKLGVVG